MVPRRILPERVLGRRGTTMAVLKKATGPMRSRTSWTTSRTVSSFGPVDARLQHQEAERHLALELVGDADHGAFGDVVVAANTSSIWPVDRRWPATLITSSTRVITET